MPSDRTFAINGRFLTQPATGVQRYAHNTVLAMDSCGPSQKYSINLLVPPSSSAIKLNNINIRRIGGSVGHLWEQFELPRVWRGPILNLCNTAPILGSRQVVCIHDANIFLAPESYSAKFRIFYKCLQPILVRKAAKITTVSRFSAEMISRFLPVSLKDIAVLPNGHEHVFSWDARQAVKVPRVLAERYHSGQTPFVLVLGSRAAHKNINIVRKIAPTLAEMGIDIIIAGGSYGIFVNEGNIKGNNIVELGFISDDDLAFLYRRALCLLFPSITEGFGLPVIEAMALGCPVISSDRASLPEICGDSALFASPFDPAAWIKQIKALCGSHHLRGELIHAGLSRVDRYRWSQTARDYFSLMMQHSS